MKRMILALFVLLICASLVFYFFNMGYPEKKLTKDECEILLDNVIDRFGWEEEDIKNVSYWTRSQDNIFKNFTTTIFNTEDNLQQSWLITRYTFREGNFLDCRIEVGNIYTSLEFMEDFPFETYAEMLEGCDRVEGSDGSYVIYSKSTSENYYKTKYLYKYLPERSYTFHISFGRLPTDWELLDYIIEYVKTK